MPPSTEPGAGAIGIREIEGVFRAEYGRAVAVLTFAPKGSPPVRSVS